MKSSRFLDRQQAGALLAPRLQAYAGRADALVLALPRGGVPVGFALAQALKLPLDIVIVRKLGAPGEEEYAIGAIASGDVCVMQLDVVRQLGITTGMLDAQIERERAELTRREALYRAGRAALPLLDKVAILVDDGLATGASMLAALTALRNANPARVIVAIPVGSHDAVEMLSEHADEVICLLTPQPFYSVGTWYDDFAQTSDVEVQQSLAQAIRCCDRGGTPSSDHPGKKMH